MVVMMLVLVDWWRCWYCCILLVNGMAGAWIDGMAAVGIDRRLLIDWRAGDVDDDGDGDGMVWYSQLTVDDHYLYPAIPAIISHIWHLSVGWMGDLALASRQRWDGWLFAGDVIRWWYWCCDVVVDLPYKVVESFVPSFCHSINRVDDDIDINLYMLFSVYLFFLFFLRDIRTSASYMWPSIVIFLYMAYICPYQSSYKCSILYVYLCTVENGQWCGFALPLNNE